MNSAGIADDPRLTAGALSRGQLFFWLFLVAGANAITGMAIQWTIGHGLGRSLFDLFGISAVIWVAFAGGLSLAHSDPAPVGRLDFWAAVIVLGAALAPTGPASSLALTLVALYVIFTSPGGSHLRRASIIFLAMTGTLLWGRLLLAMFSRPLLSLDTFFVASLVGTEQRGNLLAFADGSGVIAVAPGCSSMQGMSMAILCWALTNQWFKVPFRPASLAWLTAALAATVAINVLRIGSMALFPRYLAALHHGIGWHLFAWTTLIAVAAICLHGARHEAFARD